MSPREQKEIFLGEMNKKKPEKKKRGMGVKALQKITDNLMREGILPPPKGMDYTHPLDLPHKGERNYV